MAPGVLVTPPHESLGEHLDVFSLGAVAYHILSGQPPAADGAELATIIHKTRGLQLAAVLDNAGGPLCDLIRYATHPEVSKRFDTGTDFIEHLDLAEDDLTDPAGDEVENPAEAQVGDVLPGGLRVERRIGQGSCSITLLVTRGTGDNAEELILKAASAPEHNDRVRAEAVVLKKLSEDRDNRVVAFVESADRWPPHAACFRRSPDETHRDAGFTAAEGRPPAHRPSPAVRRRPDRFRGPSRSPRHHPPRHHARQHGRWPVEPRARSSDRALRLVACVGATLTGATTEDGRGEAELGETPRTSQKTATSEGKAGGLGQAWCRPGDRGTRLTSHPSVGRCLRECLWPGYPSGVVPISSISWGLAHEPAAAGLRGPLSRLPSAVYRTP